MNTMTIDTELLRQIIREELERERATNRVIVNPREVFADKKQPSKKPIGTPSDTILIGEHIAQIDIRDWPSVSVREWTTFANKGKNTRLYPLHYPKGSKAKPITMGRFVYSLHHLIKDIQVSYANGNPFDCRMANLVAKPRIKFSDNVREVNGRWMAELTLDGKKAQRSFKTEAEARAVAKLMGRK